MPVSGNIGPPDWAYGANVMLFDASDAYLDDYALVFADASYVTDVDWVYVGWHLQSVGTQTSVTHYIKFIDSPNLVDNQVTQLVPGAWTPTRLLVGADSNRYADTTMDIMYASAYALDHPPSAQELRDLYTRTTPDLVAWADWPLANADPSDVSGHGRNLPVHGLVPTGIIGPERSGR